MNFHHTVALAFAYVLGWAFVLGAIVNSSVSGPARIAAFLVINQKPDEFIGVVIFAWFCFTLPCAVVAILVSWSAKRSNTSA